jgi:hypothetical protein
MKWDIQEKHEQEIEELGKDEAERRRWLRVLDDPVLGAFVRKHPARNVNDAAGRLVKP